MLYHFALECLFTPVVTPCIVSFVLQMEKAVEILDEMALAGISPNEHTYTTIMNGYASLGDTGKAFEYFSKLRNDGLELDVFTYEALLKACCKAGKMQSALAVTKEMSAQKIPRNTFVYNILVDGYGLLYIFMSTNILQIITFICLHSTVLSKFGF